MNTHDTIMSVDLDANKVSWSAVMGAINALKQTADESVEDAPAVAVYDPLEDLIVMYRRGVDAFNAAHPADDEADAKAEATYRPAFRVLKAWRAPARSRASAMAALREAYTDLQDQSDDDFAARMIAAALAFFESEHGEAVQ